MTTRDYLINDPHDLIQEMLESLALTNPTVVVLQHHPVLVHVPRLKSPTLRASTVSVISGGGSGHEPAHAGFVGENLLAAAVCGPVFTSPPTQAVLAAILATSSAEKGALLVVKNYTGDRLHFTLAAQRARLHHGVPVRLVFVADDLSIAPPSPKRGLAGTLLVYKIACHLAASGAPLDRVAEAAAQAAAQLSTLSLGLSPCSLPGAPRPPSWPARTMELGLGCHGEPGVAQMPLESSRDACGRMMRFFREKAPEIGKAKQVVLMINALTALTPIELHVFVREVLRHFSSSSSSNDIVSSSLNDVVSSSHAWPSIARLYIGSFLTSLDMAGLSITLLLDPTPEQLHALDAQTGSPHWPALVHPPRDQNDPIYYPSSLSADPLSSSETLKPHASLLDSSALQFRDIVRHLASHCSDASSIQQLNELDRARGDGDTGFAVQRGGEAILEHLDRISFDSPPAALSEMAEILHTAMGGSSGAILGSCLHGISSSLLKNPADFGGALREGAAMVSELGGARVGDSTLLDALMPAAVALQNQPGGWQVAAEAAREGSERTKNLKPNFGRAAYLPDRALGHVDPGAQLIANLFQQILISLHLNH